MRPHFITVCLFYYFTYLLLFSLPPQTKPLFCLLFTFISSFHLLPPFYSPPSYINYILPQSTTSGSCFTFSCPFITPASFRSLSRAPIFKKNFSPSLRHLYSGLSFPLIRVLIIRPPCTTLLFFLPFTPSSLSSPSLLRHLLRSSVSPNFHTALQPADCLISASTHTNIG